jgi:hypothetical protein
MTIHSDSPIRPRGTVEVTCAACKWAVWVACDDPRLPDGPFSCGTNHEAQSYMDAHEVLLRKAGMTLAVCHPYPATGRDPRTGGYGVLRQREGGGAAFVVWKDAVELEGLIFSPIEWATFRDAMAAFDAKGRLFEALPKGLAHEQA